MNTKKIFTWIGIIILIVAGATIYVFSSDSFDRFLSENIRQSLQVYRVYKYFPDQIGAYKLFGGKQKGISLRHRCNKIEDNEVLRVTGRTGDACMDIISGEYYTELVASTSEIVRVDMTKFVMAKDLLQLLMQETTKADSLDGRIIFRLAPFQLGWSPVSDFDMIITHQGRQIFTGTSTMTTEFAGFASGSNDVVKYFITKYKPLDSVSASTASSTVQVR